MWTGSKVRKNDFIGQNDHVHNFLGITWNNLNRLPEKWINYNRTVLCFFIEQFHSELIKKNSTWWKKKKKFISTITKDQFRWLQLPMLKLLWIAWHFMIQVRPLVTSFSLKTDRNDLVQNDSHWTKRLSLKEMASL